MGRQHQGLDRPGARQSPRGQWKQGENGGNWLRNHLWCSKDTCGQGIDDDDDEHLFVRDRVKAICVEDLYFWIVL